MNMKLRNARFHPHRLLIVVAIIGIIATIAIQVCSARMSGNEASASARCAPSAAPVTYRRAARAAAAVTSAIGQDAPGTARRRSSTRTWERSGVVSVVKSGYTINLEIDKAGVNAAVTVSAAPATPRQPRRRGGAVPVTRGSTGQRSFGCTRGTIFYLNAGTAIPNPLVGSVTVLPLQ
jgi:hypothetical protein